MKWLYNLLVLLVLYDIVENSCAAPLGNTFSATQENLAPAHEPTSEEVYDRALNLKNTAERFSKYMTLMDIHIKEMLKNHTLNDDQAKQYSETYARLKGELTNGLEVYLKAFRPFDGPALEYSHSECGQLKLGEKYLHHTVMGIRIVTNDLIHDDKELNLEAEDEKIEGKLQVGTVEGKAEYGKIEVKAEYRKLEGEAENGKVQDGILGEHEEHDERDDEKRDLAAEKHSIPKKVIQDADATTKDMEKLIDNGAEQSEENPSFTMRLSRTAEKYLTTKNVSILASVFGCIVAVMVGVLIYVAVITQRQIRARKQAILPTHIRHENLHRNMECTPGVVQTTKDWADLLVENANFLAEGGDEIGRFYADEVMKVADEFQKDYERMLWKQNHPPGTENDEVTENEDGSQFYEIDLSE